MKNIELQALLELKDKVWTKAMQALSQDWSFVNCQTITRKIEAEVGEGAIDARSVLRFIEDLEEGVIRRRRARHVMVYYLEGKKWKTGENIDSSLYQNYLADFQKNMPNNANDAEYKINYGIYTGEYIIHYKHTRFNHANEVLNDASVIIHENGKAIFKSGAEVFDGRVEKKNDNLFFHFGNKAESIFMIVKVGLTIKQDYLNVLVGLCTCVMDKGSILYSTFMIWVKNDPKVLSKEKERVQTTFDYIGNQFIIKTNEDITRLLDVDISVSEIVKFLHHEKNDIIHSLRGYWFAYTTNAEKKSLYQSVLRIQGMNEVS